MTENPRVRTDAGETDGDESQPLRCPGSTSFALSPSVTAPLHHARLRRTFVWLGAGTLLVFAALLCVLTFLLRARLRSEVLQREANSIQAVARMQIAAAHERLAKLNVPLSTADVFAAVLESSRLNGVLAVQLFDATGNLRDSLPAVPHTVSESVWWGGNLRVAEPRFHPHGSLERVFGVVAEGDETLTPLFEVAVPLGSADDGTDFGVARYWIQGDTILDELRRMDLRLGTQTGCALLGGAVLIGLLLAWTYRQLAQAHSQLVSRTADLTRANEELDFAAKTGALGAISAHLIHGLKNPLAGLEGFVADAAASPDLARGQAQQTAVETARRLRTMVNDVVTVLRDEAAGDADYEVPARETVHAAANRATPAATAAGITLAVSAPAGISLNARVSNLAGLVLANLLTNAIEASPGGTSVRLDVAREGHGVAFSVADSGPGLPAGVRASLFRPLQSTKAGGGGLGLAISHRLARHAGGELTLVRSDTSGTVFRLMVPSSESPA